MTQNGQSAQFAEFAEMIRPFLPAGDITPAAVDQAVTAARESWEAFRARYAPIQLARAILSAEN